MDLTSYRSLGRSGLIVSPLALGTMTFGAGRWGSDENASRAVFDAYVDRGGNFVDTADIYSAGKSEEMVGKFVAEGKNRDRLVLATKFGWARDKGNPLAGGNGAKNIRLGLESSLKRLRTDYIDMYWLHVWDRVTPAEEVLQVLADAVRAGKVLHYGFSNAPGWYVAKIATLAKAHGLPGPIALQYQYSLVDRGVEFELLPAGEEFDLGMVPWSPLAAGLLTGKYGREMLAEAGRGSALPDKSFDKPEGATDGRLNGDNPFGGMLFTERNFGIVDAVRKVAEETGRSMAEVALAWVAGRPGVSSVLIGASRAEQLTQNIKALDVSLSSAQLAELDKVSANPAVNPYFIFQLPPEVIFGAPSVKGWRTA